MDRRRSRDRSGGAYITRTDAFARLPQADGEWARPIDPWNAGDPLYAWTGLNADMTNHLEQCLDWTSVDPNETGQVGAYGEDGATAYAGALASCDDLYAVICVQ